MFQREEKDEETDRHTANPEPTTASHVLKDNDGTSDDCVIRCDWKDCGNGRPQHASCGRQACRSRQAHLSSGSGRGSCPLARLEVCTTISVLQIQLCTLCGHPNLLSMEMGVTKRTTESSIVWSWVACARCWYQQSNRLEMEDRC